MNLIKIILLTITICNVEGTYAEVLGKREKAKILYETDGHYWTVLVVATLLKIPEAKVIAYAVRRPTSYARRIYPGTAVDNLRPATCANACRVLRATEVRCRPSRRADVLQGPTVCQIGRRKVWAVDRQRPLKPRCTRTRHLAAAPTRSACRSEFACPAQYPAALRVIRDVRHQRSDIERSASYRESTTEVGDGS